MSFSDAVDQSDLEDSVRGQKQREARSPKAVAGYLANFSQLQLLEIRNILLQEGIEFQIGFCETYTINPLAPYSNLGEP